MGSAIALVLIVCAVYASFYDTIQGTTDSEHTFALFLSHLYERIADHDTPTVIVTVAVFDTRSPSYAS